MTIGFISGADLISVHMREMMNRMSRLDESEEGGWSPSVDIYETKDGLVLVVEVAGVSRQDVRIIVDGPVVRIYGNRHPTCCHQGARYHRMEITSGGFVRYFRIGVPFMASKVSARFEDGLLYVVLPKEQPDQE